jgi:hypothetical protein
MFQQLAMHHPLEACYKSVWMSLFFLLAMYSHLKENEKLKSAKIKYFLKDFQ